MPDALDLLKTRKSVSAAFLAPPGPNADEIEEILTIASRVPDHGKLAPWRFVIFAGDARIKASDGAGRALRRARIRAPTPRRSRRSASAWRGRRWSSPWCGSRSLHPKIPEWEQMLSAGNAAFNIVLASHALGYAAQWTTGWIATDEDAGRILGLLPGERFVAFVHIGTPTRRPARPAAPAADRLGQLLVPAVGLKAALMTATCSAASASLPAKPARRAASASA